MKVIARFSWIQWILHAILLLGFLSAFPIRNLMALNSGREPPPLELLLGALSVLLLIFYGAQVILAVVRALFFSGAMLYASDGRLVFMFRFLGSIPMGEIHSYQIGRDNALEGVPASIAFVLKDGTRKVLVTPFIGTPAPQIAATLEDLGLSPHGPSLCPSPD